MLGSSSAFVAISLLKPPSPIPLVTPPNATRKLKDYPLAKVAHAAEWLPSATLVDTIIVNMGTGTIFMLLGGYVCGFALPEDNKEEAMLLGGTWPRRLPLRWACRLRRQRVG